MRYLIILLTLVITVNANYCIQVMTANLSNKRGVLAEASRSVYRSFQDLRVERKGNYLVLRIGDYRRYNDSEEDLYNIRGIRRDAYVRTCDFNPQNALYVNNISNPQFSAMEEPSYNENERYRSSEARQASYNKDSYRDNTYRSPEKITPSYNRDNNYQVSKPRKKRYIRDDSYQEPQLQRYEAPKQRRTSYSRDNDYSRPQDERKYKKLSNDCEKCFIPHYKDGVFDF